MPNKDCNCTEKVYQVSQIKSFKVGYNNMVGYQVKEICAECRREIILLLVQGHDYEIEYVEDSRKQSVKFYCE